MEVKSPFCVAHFDTGFEPDTTRILIFKTHGILLLPSSFFFNHANHTCAHDCHAFWGHWFWFRNARFYAHELNMNHKCDLRTNLLCTMQRARSSRNMVSLVGQAVVTLGGNMFFQGQFQIVTHFFSAWILQQKFTLRLKLKAHKSGRSRWLRVPQRKKDPKSAWIRHSNWFSSKEWAIEDRFHQVSPIWVRVAGQPGEATLGRISPCVWSNHWC